ncbi:MAG: uridine diphosphate-N-acetylglucosamine-binding protein YvcK [Pseudidiomarina maritima]|nr:uridine diphosphate-N-acetylglucosamine-binding protein YvcK [Pseudidiomarina maritima]
MTLKTSPSPLVTAPRQLQQLRSVTAIGGGHGLGRVLSTLAFLNRRLIGIVATTDDGGASGLLRRNHDCIAWGDIRNCLSQLAKHPLAADVLNYRFTTEHSLHGHNLGNLLLYTLDQLSARPLDGIALLSRLLNINTRLLPMSETPVDLVAATHDGMECFGELLVDGLQQMPAQLRLSQPVVATPEALHHVERSELIILGPGSFLTSVMPPLLVEEFAQAIANSAAQVIFIDNLVPENSPAGQLSLSEKLAWMEQQLGVQVVDKVITNRPDPNLTLPSFDHVCPSSEAAHRHQPESLLAALTKAFNA